MANKTLPDQGYLCQCFSYDAMTGVSIWKRRPLSHFKDERAWKIWNTRYSMKTAGWIGLNGYQCFTLDYNHLYAHRVIFKIMTGLDPANTVDHRNLDRLDNRWENLRAATIGENSHNTPYQGAVSGKKGVKLLDGRFFARIQVKGKQISLGGFATAEEAHEAYCSAAQRLFGEFWNRG